MRTAVQSMRCGFMTGRAFTRDCRGSCGLFGNSDNGSSMLLSCFRTPLKLQCSPAWQVFLCVLVAFAMHVAGCFLTRCGLTRACQGSIRLITTWTFGNDSWDFHVPC